MHPAHKRGPSFVGTVIGEKYRLEAPIGEGGMATVWQARHLTLNRPVAVKFIHVMGDPDAVRDRFLREARVAAAVSHRNVVHILDFGTTDEGRPYMVMEYLEGQTLRQRLEDGPTLSVGDIVRIAARGLSGLGAVHDAGIVHRDVKPGNIFLISDADGIYPKLLDFGVSRAMHSDMVQSVLPSHENAITGTPQYMAPEQARGLKDIDHRADLYAMGVVLYEALTGRLPFDCDRIGDLIMMILSSEFVPLETLRPDLGHPLSDVVNRALARNRDARFDDAREMRQALLDAAARTAMAMSERPADARSRASDSVFPRAMPQELMDAVGEAYEPGDSQVLPASSIPAPPAVPPPAAFPRNSDLPTLDDPKLPPPPKAPSRDIETVVLKDKPRRWPWVLLGLVATAGAGWVAAGTPGLDRLREAMGQSEVGEPMAAPTPEPQAAPELAQDSTQDSTQESTEGSPVEAETQQPAPLDETVTVTLEGVPEDATVTVDGEPHEGDTVELPRGDEEHAIEVTAPDHDPWRVAHTATEDARYTVELERAQTERDRRRERRRRLRRLRRLRQQQQQPSEMILTDPGF